MCLEKINKKSHVVAAQRRLIEAGKTTTARKLRAYLRAAYTTAIVADSDSRIPQIFTLFEIVDNPVASTAPIKGKASKNPLLKDDLLKYWSALKEETSISGAALRLHVLTGGQRIAQLVRIHASRDIAPDALRLLDAKGKREDAREHLVPITPHVREELANLSSKGYVLSTDGGQTHMHPTSLTTWAREIGRNAGIEEFQLKRVRSGVETLLAAARVTVHVRGQLQSHGISGVQAKHYDAYEYMPEKRRALTLLYSLLEPKAKKQPARGQKGG